MADINIYGTLRNATTDNTIVKTDQVKDSVQNKTQEQINKEVSSHLADLDDNTIGSVTANMYSNPNTDPSVQVVYENGTLHFNFDGLQGDAATIKVGTTTTSAAGGDAKVTNSGTKEDAIFNFTIPRGFTGPKGEKGDGWEIKGFVDTDEELKTKEAKLGDTYVVGTTLPYHVYMYNGTSFVNIGSTTEIKASVIDGGRADTQYGGTRTIDCGGADAFLTT